MRPQLRYLFYFFLTILLLFSVPGLSSKVVKVKGKNIIIKASEKFEKGQRITIVNKKGKKKGIAKVRRVKGKRVTARMVKGKARKGYKAMGSGSSSAKASKSKSSKGGSSAFGVLVGLGTNTMKVGFTADDECPISADITATGSGTNFLASYSMAMSRQFALVFSAGLESFNGSSGDEVPCSDVGATAEYKISYFGINGLAKYLFTTSKSFAPWAAAGCRALAGFFEIQYDR